MWSLFFWSSFFFQFSAALRELCSKSSVFEKKRPKKAIMHICHSILFYFFFFLKTASQLNHFTNCLKMEIAFHHVMVNWNTDFFFFIFTILCKNHIKMSPIFVGHYVLCMMCEKKSFRPPKAVDLLRNNTRNTSRSCMCMCKCGRLKVSFSCSASFGYFMI